MQLLEHFNELSLHPKNAKELKGLILQLAVEGKLTENWRKENPQITIDQKEIAKHFSMTTSELLKHSDSIKEIDVPSSWLKVNFSIVFDIKGGSQPPKTMFIQEPRKGYVQLFQIRDFGKKPQPVYVPVDSVSKLCTEDDIMIGRYGASIGKIFYGQNGAYNVALVRLIWNRQILIQDFVYQLFYARKIQEFFQNCSRSAQAGFNKTDLEELNITLPPLEEQKAIVEVVNQLFAEVDQLETLTKERIHLKEDFATSALRQLSTGNTANEWAFLKEHFSTFFTEKSNIKKLRESILQLAVQGKLTADWRSKRTLSGVEVEHASELLERIKAEKEKLVKEKKIKKEKPLPKISEEEIPYDLPEGWVWCRIGDLVMEMAYGTSQKTNDDSESVPVLRMGNVLSTGNLHYNNLKYIPKSHPDLPKLYLKKEDIVFNRTNSYELVGKSAVYEKGDGEFTLASYLIKVTLHNSMVDSVYVKNYINSNVCRKLQIEPQITAQTNQANFSGSKLKAVLVPFTSLEEQKVIVEKVNALMALCDALELAIEESKQTQEQWMGSSLREVFEGEEEMSEL